MICLPYLPVKSIEGVLFIKLVEYIRYWRQHATKTACGDGDDILRLDACLFVHVRFHLVYNAFD